MNSLMSTDTSLALMQATQAKAENLAKQAMSSQEKRDAQLEIVAKDFEAVFITEMMKPMFAGIKTDSKFGGGKGEEIFRGIMLQEYGKMISETGQIGIADSIKAELIQMQETTAR